jgi:hypothetical protein
LQDFSNGRNWARTSDLRLVDSSGGVGGSACKRIETSGLVGKGRCL